MKWRIPAAIIGVLTICGAADATIYTWVDDNGVKHFSDIAGSPAASKADPGKLQTVESDGSALAFARRLAAQKVRKKQQAKRPEPPETSGMAKPREN